MCAIHGQVFGSLINGMIQESRKKLACLFRDRRGNIAPRPTANDLEAPLPGELSGLAKMAEFPRSLKPAANLTKNASGTTCPTSIHQKSPGPDAPEAPG